MKVKEMLKRSKVWVKSTLNIVIKTILSIGYIILNGTRFRGEWGFT